MTLCACCALTAPSRSVLTGAVIINYSSLVNNASSPDEDETVVANEGIFGSTGLHKTNVLVEMCENQRRPLFFPKI